MRRLQCCVLVCVLVFALGGSSALAAWSGTRTLQGPSSSLDPAAANPRAAIAGDGRAVVAWYAGISRLTVRAACSDRRGRWTQPKVVAKRSVLAGPLGPGVASDRLGDELLAWVQSDGLYAAVRRQGSACLGGARRLARLRSGSDLDGDVKVTGAGRSTFVLAFVDQGHVRAVSVDSRSHRLGAVQDLGPGRLYISGGDHGSGLNSDASGDAFLLWGETSPGGRDDRLALSTQPAGGVFASPQLLPDVAAYSPALAVAPDGRYAVAWTHAARSGDAGVFGPPMISQGTVGADLGPALQAPAGPAQDAYLPQAAFLASRQLAVVWQLKTHPAPFTLIGAVFEATLTAGVFGGPQRAGTFDDAVEPQITPLADGSALVISARAQRLAAEVIDTNGKLREIRPPRGRTDQFHNAGANRDLNSSGRYAITTWPNTHGIQASIYR